jgi:magnesium-transporting ATPase (P-type)
MVTRSDANPEELAIVVSGKAIGAVFPRRLLDKNKKEIIPPADVLESEKKLQLHFLDICTRCKAVVCCRMSPKQKSQVVRLVKDNTSAITLAIGDGANDVAMIESAHVGVGIEGLEGKQAVMSSDYSIGQFRFLMRLLLVHGNHFYFPSSSSCLLLLLIGLYLLLQYTGAWSYRRLATLILYSFYKNVTIALTQIWFAFYCGASAQIFYDALAGSLFNLLFTAIPVLAVAMFNRDLPQEQMLEHPKLYASGHRNEGFNIKRLAWFMFKGVADSLILFMFAMVTFGDPSSTSPDGHSNDLWTISTAMFSALVMVVNVKIALDTTTWVKASVLFWVLTIISYWVFMLIYTSVESLNPDMYGVMWRLVTMPSFWVMTGATLALTCIPDVAQR